MMHSRFPTTPAVALLAIAALLACKKSAPPPTGETPGATTPTAEATPPQPTTPPPPAKTFNVGETATTSDYKLTIENVKECKPGPWLKPTKGNIWLGVEVTLEAVGDKQVFPSQSNMKVVDGEGNVVKQVFATGSKACEPTLGHQALSKGEKTKGWVHYELPTKASGLKFSYQPSAYPPQPAVKFDLGR